MNAKEWDAAGTEFRDRVLKHLIDDDVRGIPPDTPFNDLPYWLKRHIAHHVRFIV